MAKLTTPLRSTRYRNAEDLRKAGIAKLEAGRKGGLVLIQEIFGLTAWIKRTRLAALSRGQCRATAKSLWPQTLRHPMAP